MRTMLILLFICSLAQFAIAQADGFVPEGCGTAFKCYVPMGCFNRVPFDPASFMITEVKDQRQIWTQCSAMIKIQSFGKHWAYVTIESFDDSVTSVEFVHQDSVGTVKNKFTCKLDQANVKGTYGPKVDVETEPYLKTQGKPIKCEIEVKLGRDKELFDKDNDEIKFTIGNVDTQLTSYMIHHPLPVHCNPSRLGMRNSPTVMDKVYEKVQYSPEKYYCKLPNIYKIENRDGDKLMQDVKLTCKPGTLGVPSTFEVAPADGSTPIQVDDLDVRCVADVKYFCNPNDVKEKPNPKGDPTIAKLIPTEGDKIAAIASALECPTTHSYLFVNGKPLMKAEISCANFGNKQLWTVGSQQLTKLAPEVYCSSEVACDLLFKLKESAVTSGKLTREHHPICHGAGILKEDATEQPIDTDKTRCDRSTGSFKYTLVGSSEEKIMDSTSKFKCEYIQHPKKEDLDKDIDNKIAKGIVYATVASGLLIIIGIAAVTLVTRHDLRKKRKQREQADNELFVQFAMNKAEQAALREKQSKASKNSKNKEPKKAPASGGAPDTTWNDMLFFTQFDAMQSLTVDGSDGKYAADIPNVESQVANIGTPSVIDTLPKLLFSRAVQKFKGKRDPEAKGGIIEVWVMKAYIALLAIKEEQLKKKVMKKLMKKMKKK